MAEYQPTTELWVFSEKAALLHELIGGARALAQAGGKVAALVLGSRAEADAALARGADRALWLGEAADVLVDDYIDTIAALMASERPRALLIGATKRGRAVAGRLAARFDATALTDVLEFLPADGTDEAGLAARHMIFGGGAVRDDRALALPVIATAAAGVFAAQPEQPGAGEVVAVEFVEPARRVKLRDRKVRPSASVNLPAARRVVCAGRGVGKQEDLALVEDLARALNAEVACTRPLAEGLDWLPRERYIGISGAMIRPDLYLGVGVSGQSQHVIGMSESRVVVAINKDPNAPIAAQADYILPQDLYEVVPALIEALRARR